MKIIIKLYFLCYVVSGGFRHIAFETAFFSFLNGIESPDWLQYLALILQITSILYLISPKKELILFFYLTLLFSDVYVQNFVKFESSVILLHQFPLIAYLFFHRNLFGLDESKLRYALLLMISVGYLSSGISKWASGWLDFTKLSIVPHLQKIQYYFQVPVLITLKQVDWIPFWLWKTLDIVVVLFQLSFGMFFWSLRGLKLRLWALLFFHLGISFFMGIHVFYFYPLIYALLLFSWELENADMYLDRIFRVLGWLLLVHFIYFPLDTNIIMKRLPISFYMYYDLFFTMCSCFFCALVIWKSKVVLKLD
jgi:hypothetical protein